MTSTLQRTGQLNLGGEFRAKIIETKQMVGNSEQYTGHYRLIGSFPGDYIELPGDGDNATVAAANRALAVFAEGGSHQHAQDAATGRNGVGL